jgi:hypothetical protein
MLPEAEMQVLRGRAKHLRVYRWLQGHWDDYLEDARSFPTLIEYFLTGLREARASRRGSTPEDEQYAAAARAA